MQRRRVIRFVRTLSFWTFNLSTWQLLTYIYIYIYNFIGPLNNVQCRALEWSAFVRSWNYRTFFFWLFKGKMFPNLTEVKSPDFSIVWLWPGKALIPWPGWGFHRLQCQEAPINKMIIFTRHGSCSRQRKLLFLREGRAHGVDTPYSCNVPYGPGWATDVT